MSQRLSLAKQSPQLTRKLFELGQMIEAVPSRLEAGLEPAVFEKVLGRSPSCSRRSSFETYCPGRVCLRIFLMKVLVHRPCVLS